MASVKAAISGKCPKCEKGAIFIRKGNIAVLRIPEMHASCPECGYRYEKEPGYFLGAMYVSYGLTVIEMLLIFFITYAFVPLWLFFVLILGSLIAFSFFNFRIGRTLWIHLFPY